MRALASLMLLILLPHQALGEEFLVAPECPGFPNKKACLASLKDHYSPDANDLDGKHLMLSPDSRLDGDESDVLILAALACNKTCPY